MTWVLLGVCLAGLVPGALRWLRVAQREHYLAGSVFRFAGRWWRCGLNPALALPGAAGVVVAAWWPPAVLVTVAAGVVGPVGLGLRGRTSKLAWTRRLRTLAGVVGGLEVVAVGAGLLGGVRMGLVVAAWTILALPLVVDLACAVTAPLEERLAAGYVARAADRLRRVVPQVVAITGSYGKTSTKGYVAHLLGGSRAVVASPASFNNRAGLARAVNEHLADSTEVFVAEMGTYGPGEIAELCRWITPDVAVITAIGPVHLERFRTEERIVEAKSEILASAPAVVLVVDDGRLAALADRAATEGRRVHRVSALDPSADVSALVEEDGTLTVRAGGEELARGVPGHAQPGNVACAVAVALELGVDRAEIGRRLGTLPTVAHRLEPVAGSGGAVVLDDTYNANPAGARAGLDRLASLDSPGGRRVVVTPGMVELGPRQEEENARFAEAAAGVATDLVVVGRTNRRALLGGAARAGVGAARVEEVAGRSEAVAWVRAQLGPGDVVLYENDLPDHYP